MGGGSGIGHREATQTMITEVVVAMHTKRWQETPIHWPQVMKEWVKKNKEEMKKNDEACNKAASKSGGAPANLISVNKKPHQYQPGSRALMEITRYQKRFVLLCRKLPLQRLVWEISDDMKANLRWQGAVIITLQEASESYLVDLLVDSSMIAINAKHITIMLKDMLLVRWTRNHHTM